jgi:RNA polymerase sigma-32 factor
VSTGGERERQRADAAKPAGPDVQRARSPEDPDSIDPEAVEPEVAEDGEVELEDSPASPQALVPLAPGAGERGLVPLDPLRAYFNEVSRYPLLSREQERDLAVRVHDQGDADAAQTLVLSNLRLVIKIAMEYRRVWANVLDLIQEGNVGLLQAVRRFDPHRNVKLSSYGAYWIRAYILKYLIDNIRTVRVGSSRAERKLFFALNRAKRQLEREGFQPVPALLAERLDVKPEDVISMERRLAQSDLSLDAPVSSDPGASTLGDFQPARGLDAEQALAEGDVRTTFRTHVEEFAKGLDERDSVILRERLIADEPATLQEIGDRFGLTRERVRQLEKKVVDRLRAYMREHLVDFEYWAS